MLVREKHKYTCPDDEALCLACGYRADHTGISFKHIRYDDGDSAVIRKCTMCGSEWLQETYGVFEEQRLLGMQKGQARSCVLVSAVSSCSKRLRYYLRRKKYKLELS